MIYLELNNGFKLSVFNMMKKKKMKFKREIFSF